MDNVIPFPRPERSPEPPPPVLVPLSTETLLEREKARTRILTAYLDKVRPGWRKELEWD